MQEDYGGYARRRKKPGKGRYPMGPTNIDRVDIGSCVWYPTFLVDTVSGRRLRVSTRMKMANQVKRSKIANCLKKNYGGYAGRLRRLCTEKEKARERSVPDGSDKYACLHICNIILRVQFVQMIRMLCTTLFHFINVQQKTEVEWIGSESW